jgi:hypothetical protein
MDTTMIDAASMVEGATPTPPEAAVIGEERPAAGDDGAEERVLDPALALAREALIAAHPEAVPELIGGTSVDELRASVEIARQAYARVAATVRSRQDREAISPAAVTRSRPLDAAALSPSA